ncbi:MULTISPECIES: hypothetical protein [Sphingomonadales]|jgi:hypothetical protein|uniref:hypothetical protein n=1 Tax=Sphingomonadales TaxID=204457 RepID=UPI0012D96130|nr:MULTISPECIES: hypothetical protein [Sphingomonadales]
MNRTIILRDGTWGYWLTVEPPHHRYPAEYFIDRASLYRRAVTVMGLLGRVSCHDMTTDDRSNSGATNTHFMSQQPWNNNDYRHRQEVSEPTFFDARLLPE